MHISHPRISHGTRGFLRFFTMDSPGISRHLRSLQRIVFMNFYVEISYLIFYDTNGVKHQSLIHYNLFTEAIKIKTSIVLQKCDMGLLENKPVCRNESSHSERTVRFREREASSISTRIRGHLFTHIFLRILHRTHYATQSTC